ncbi:MAG: hypothetical protein ABI276_04540 [Acidimicrobiales bacterium]
MPAYRITLNDRSVELIDQADAYRQEGQMTTFFRTAPGRELIDSWSTRLASFRTSEVLAIRRLEAAASAGSRAESEVRPRRARAFGCTQPVAAVGG